MDKTLALLVAVVALAGVALGGLAFVRSGDLAEMVKAFGSASSVSVENGCTTINGQRICYYNRPSTSTTTAAGVICSFKSPTATSTLNFAGLHVSTGTTTAVVVTLAKAATPIATTTSIGTDYAIAASAKATIIASTTPYGAADPNIFAPNTYFNISLKGGSGGTSTYGSVGNCFAEFREMPNR